MQRNRVWNVAKVSLPEILSLLCIYWRSGAGRLASLAVTVWGWDFSLQS